MYPDTNLQFIKDKIYQVRTAIMYSMSNELVRIPNSLVEAVDIDEQGQLWFTCKPPVHPIEACEQTFPVRLHFYKKGSAYHMEVSGRATVINNEYTTYFAADAEGRKPLLLKMTMQQVEYTEPQEKRKTKMEAWLEHGYKWFLRTAAVSHSNKPNFAGLQTANNI